MKTSTFLFALLPWIVTAVSTYAGSPIQSVPSIAAAKMNPLEGQERARQAGAKIFSRECAACHGSHAEGRDVAPALRQPEVYYAPPGAIFWVLRNGSLRRGHAIVRASPRVAEMADCDLFEELGSLNFIPNFNCDGEPVSARTRNVPASRRKKHRPHGRFFPCTECEPVLPIPLYPKE